MLVLNNIFKGFSQSRGYSSVVECACLACRGPRAPSSSSGTERGEGCVSPQVFYSVMLRKFPQLRFH